MFNINRCIIVPNSYGFYNLEYSFNSTIDLKIVEAIAIRDNNASINIKYYYY